MLTTDYIYNGTLPALKSLLTLLTKIPQYLQKLAPQAIPPLLHTPPSPLPPLVHSLEKPQTAPHSGEQPGVPPWRNWALVPGPWEHINMWSVCLLPWLMGCSSQAPEASITTRQATCYCAPPGLKCVCNHVIKL